MISCDVCFICNSAIYPDDESVYVEQRNHKKAHFECAEDQFPEEDLES